MPAAAPAPPRPDANTGGAVASGPPGPASSSGPVAPAAPAAFQAPISPRAPPIPRGAARRLLVPTASYVLGIGAQSTFLFFLAPALTRHAGAAHLDPWVFSASAFASMSVSLLAGRLSDTLGRRPVMRAGWWLMALGSLAVLPPLLASGAPWAPAAAWILLGTVLVGAGLALSFVAYMSYVSDLVREETESALDGGERGSLARSYGVTSAVAVLASAAGPFAGAALFRALRPDAAAGLVAVAVLLAAMGAAAALISLRLPTLRPLGQPGRGAKPDLARYVWRPRTRGDRAVWAMNVAFLVMGVGYGAVLPYFAAHFLDTLDVVPSAWGALLGASTVVGGLAVLASGALAARVPLKPLLVCVTAATALAMLPLPLTAGVGVAAACFLARAAFGNMPGTAMNALLMTSADPESRGEAMGASTLLWNLGWAVGALVGGLLHVALGAWIFPLGMSLGLVGVLLGFTLMPHAEAHEAPAAPRVVTRVAARR